MGYSDPRQPQILWSHLTTDEVEALEWWRATVSRRINALAAVKAAAERARDFNAARGVNPDLSAAQRLSKAIGLFWRALCGPVGKSPPFSKWVIGDDGISRWQVMWGTELLEEIAHVDFVLMYGIPARLVADWFPELAAEA